MDPRALASRAENLAIAAGERLLPLRLQRCPCCGWTGLRFRAFAAREYMRRNVICPACGSFERHRAMATFYPATLRALPAPPRCIVHFAAEQCLAHTLEPLCGRYWTSTFEKDVQADVRLDLTALGLRNDSCDVLLMNHVLDCMPDDRPTIAEMYRALRPGGIVLAAVTVEREEPATRELPVTSTKRYRAYGRDIAERFRPFRAELVNAAAGVDPAVRAEANIPDDVPILFLRKDPGGPR